MKLWERVVEASLRKVVEICEQQYGFMPRKSTTDAIFALRILMEKYRDGQRELHCVFVDLEKAYDRVPREELWYCMRKSGVAEKYVRVVQDMYERSRTVVRCAVGQTEEFNVEVGLHQGSALSPFLFAIVMDQLSEEVRQESPWTMMFADDIVICSESREQVEENLERWRFALERRGMKVSRSKTEYMCVNEREGSGTVRLQSEEVKKVQEFKYLGSTVQSNGECGKEVKKRVQAGWNGWRKVLGVLCDQKISARIKGKVYRTVVRPAMLYGLETVSLRKRQESELEVAELKMLRFSLGVTRLDRISNEYIRGTAHVGRLGDKVREARLRWFGHVQRRESEYIGRRMLDMDLPGRRQRGRPKRSWRETNHPILAKSLEKLFLCKYKRHLSTTSNSQTPNSTMAKTKELSKDTRNKIVDLHQAGKTESAIEKCDDALATPLSHSAFSSSSVFTIGYGPEYAKLNRRGGAGGWSPLDTDHYPWLQVDLGSRKQVTAVATQGRYSSSDWTTRYRLLYSDTGRNWKPYHQDGNIWTFTGNSNTESVVRHNLQHSVVARFLCFIPLDWSEEGRIGLRIEIYGCSYWADVINFDGQGVISYRFKMKKMKILKDVIALKFKTAESDGVILHGEGSNQYGSILGHTSVSSGSLLDDHHWHSVVIERYRRNVNFTLDLHTQHFRTNGEFDHLDLDYERNLTFSCVESHTFPVSFNATSFLQLPGRRENSMVSVSFQFRTWNSNGLLVFSALADGMLELTLKDGKVTAHISIQQQKNLGVDMISAWMCNWIKYNAVSAGVCMSCWCVYVWSGLNDGEWHDVRFLAKENFAMLTIDRDEASAVRTSTPVQITTGGTYHFGGKGRELADMMERRKVDILCVQETRWKGSKARSIGAGFKLFYYGVDSKRNGVGVVLKEEFVRNVLEVKRVSDRVMSLKLEFEGVMLNVVSGYAPQVGCELEEKERFWSELDEVMESIPTGERVVIGVDFNGHVGEGNTGDEEVMGKFGVKERNLEGQMVVDFAKRMDMGVVNTYFQKREEHRVTYKSGGRRTQVGYILCRRGNLKLVTVKW
ncbi:hypothetical protein QTP86_002363 [Hemibagrus guttatus]|nr:hypothetical protein QTP86_002363 [Hemibagrus guttatus]